ncbi:uncharacterized protein BO96DRAFT_102463 [Aspergillus niger CBS 101883]|uniref:uncharacterized protein n=1 Tax=Aspergillus lacticoffeatus (strain CBS 101883) TaxID=1450533 RepID=UPI000D7F6B8C|nr:uncharacterized protein BO96DRAFT_102463 [Aspergillus niger CBS 101883]PYH54595.1 hypothetical protein BO96DRAFT_102463 [Aspergillus niger CBS 101883]
MAKCQPAKVLMEADLVVLSSCTCATSKTPVKLFTMLNSISSSTTLATTPGSTVKPPAS